MTYLGTNYFVMNKRRYDHNLTSYAFLDLEGITSDHETRLTAAEENIQGKSVLDPGFP